MSSIDKEHLIKLFAEKIVPFIEVTFNHLQSGSYQFPLGIFIDKSKKITEISCWRPTMNIVENLPAGTLTSISHVELSEADSWAEPELPNILPNISISGYQCPNKLCGGNILECTNMVLASDPPKNIYKCNNCYRKYILIENRHLIRYC